LPNALVYANGVPAGSNNTLGPLYLATFCALSVTLGALLFNLTTVLNEYFALQQQLANKQEVWIGQKLHAAAAGSVCWCPLSQCFLADADRQSFMQGMCCLRTACSTSHMQASCMLQHMWFAIVYVPERFLAPVHGGAAQDKPLLYGVDVSSSKMFKSQRVRAAASFAAAAHAGQVLRRNTGTHACWAA
jgi:hypothetical protein